MSTKMQMEECASTSKRVLFPSNHKDNSSSDENSLGHMSPLSMSSSPDRYSSPPPSPQWLSETPVKNCNKPLSKSNCAPVKDKSPRRISRYDSYLQELSSRVVTPSKTTQTNGPRRSPRFSINSPHDAESLELTPLSMDLIAETPEKDTNTETLMTPFKCLARGEMKSSKTEHKGTSGLATVRRVVFTPQKGVFKKSHQYILDSADKRTVKHKSVFNPDTVFKRSISDILQTVFYKPPAPKARTALFQEPKRTHIPFVGMKRRRSPSVVSSKVTRSTKASLSLWGSRWPTKRFKMGEINRGVCHRIKKPKPKKKSLPKLPLLTPQDRINEYLAKTAQNKTNNNMIQELQTNKKVTLPNVRCSDLHERKVVPLTTPKKAPLVIESVPNPSSDPSKKFFKTNRTLAINHMATVTIDNMKLQVSNGKLSLLETSTKKPKSAKRLLIEKAVVQQNDVFEDMVVDMTPDPVQHCVETILNKLEVDQTISAAPGTPSPSGVSFSSMNIVGIRVQEPSMPSLDSTSIDISHVPTNDNLDLNSNPSIVEEDKENTTDSKKLYPVFSKNNKGLSDSTNKAKTPGKQRTPISTKKRWKPIGDDQYQIDAGQKWFGATQCQECGIVYQRGDPEDEISHDRIHNNIQNLKYSGWKQERVVRNYSTGRVIVVYPDDPKAWLKKVKDVLEVVDRELGFVDYSTQQLQISKVYLYVTDKRVLGCLMAEPKTTAYRMLDSGMDGIDCCTTESYPVKCGVSRVWTVADQRRCLVASRLMDCMRLTFMFDRILSMNDFAFSVPTTSGKAFAEKYTGTSEFMVYN